MRLACVPHQHNQGHEIGTIQTRWVDRVDNSTPLQSASAHFRTKITMDSPLSGLGLSNPRRAETEMASSVFSWSVAGSWKPYRESPQALGWCDL